MNIEKILSQLDDILNSYSDEETLARLQSYEPGDLMIEDYLTYSGYDSEYTSKETNYDTSK